MITSVQILSRLSRIAVVATLTTTALPMADAGAVEAVPDRAPAVVVSPPTNIAPTSADARRQLKARLEAARDAHRAHRRLLADSEASLRLRRWTAPSPSKLRVRVMRPAVAPTPVVLPLPQS